MKRKIEENPYTGDAGIDVIKIATDDIWTFEKAAGKRIVFPWQTEGLPPGFVQMDVIFS